ncbi:Hsp70 family protein [Glycomyces paridis]|uniref:Hsp70 family protein n=1 Tax=Glycomyces paridis TaxID=2126555 RepID=A0A4S8PKM1_9ACTN|nr:Hsp70 family protein [Glycomyces paridis]THV30621.1 hypothetical protein E9998_04330 [Glycomyces paridis]
MDPVSRTAAALGVDFGTHNTVATVVRGDGRRHQLLFEGNPLLPSGIYLGIDANVLVGRDAAREGRLRPERYERNPKLRLGEGSLLLADKEIPVREAVAAVLRRVIAECGTTAGLPRAVTVTVPAGWGPARRHIVADAAASAGAGAPILMPEPVAAARYFAEVLGHALEPGRAVVVFDLGAGTFDASAVARTGTGYEVLAVDGSDRIGGHYLDQALVEYLGGRYDGSEERAGQWRALLAPGAPSATLRRRFALYDEVREAKERLSRSTATEIAVPGFANDELMTRAELELLARPLLTEAVAITKAVMREAGLGPDRVAGVFMVGGASRMPLAATMIHQELGIAPTLIEQPELVVSEGAVAGSATAPPLPVTPAAALPPVTPAASPSPQTPGTLPPAGYAAPALLSPVLPVRPNRTVPWLLALVVVLALALVAGVTWFLTDAAGRDGEPSGESDTTEETSASAVEETADETADWSEVSIVAIDTTPTTITVRTSAEEGMEGCTAVIDAGAGAETYPEQPCDEFTLEELWANTGYAVAVYGPGEDPADAEATPLEGEATTPMQLGTVYWDCPSTREYCREQGGDPGVRGTADVADTVAYAEVGEEFDLVCYETAETITPRGEEADGYWDYHPGKDASDVMVRVRLSEGEFGYVPFVWLVIDPEDVNSLGGVRPC